MKSSSDFTIVFFFQKPGKKGIGESGWATQAKLDICLWLGEMDPKKKVKPYLDALPAGFEPEYKFGPSTPASAITYPGMYIPFLCTTVLTPFILDT